MSTKQEPAAAARRAAPPPRQGVVGISLVHEEEEVKYADKFHSKRTPPVFFSADSYAASIARFGEDKVTRFKELRTRFGVPDLAPLVAAHGHALV